MKSISAIEESQIDEQKKLYQDAEEPADFEKAILASGWGKFNIILYILSVTAGCSSVFEASTMSYVFPAAECDLNLKLEHKGLLNAITYIGMISSGFMWGYLCDTLGRKKLLIIGYLLDWLFVLLAGISQSFAMLITAKFFGGFIINGPFSALVCYLSEIHPAKYRSIVQMALGIVFSSATFFIPALALGILPLGFTIELHEYFVIHAWNVYLLICSLIPLISCVAFMFLPESPKFLMTIGNNEKALGVFKKIYRLNTGKSEDTYPIKVLINEIEMNQHKKHGKVTANRTKKEALMEGWSQIRPLFCRPYLGKFLFVCVIQCLTMSSLNTLRLWLPQLFQAVNDYQQSSNKSAPLCDMLAVFNTKNHTEILEPVECIVNTNNYDVYINSMIIGLASIVAYIAAAGLINKVGKKRLYIILGILSGLSAVSLYFARDMVTTLILASLFICAGSIMINTMLCIIVDLFPTTLRTVTVAIVMMGGRSGAALGNVIFPLLLEIGCAPPFLFVGLTSLTCAILGLLLPNTEMKSLE